MKSPIISVISVYVNDVPAAKTFYSSVLGFAVLAEPAPGLVMLKHDGVKLLLTECARPASGRYSEDGGVVLGIGIADVDAEVRRLRNKGTNALFPTAQEFPGGRFNAIADPAGNVIELLEFAA